MDEAWFLLILLAVAASFLPLQFGFEVSLLGKDDGIKNGFGFSIGVALFRIVLFVGLGVIFTGLLAVISNLFSNISAGIGIRELTVWSKEDDKIGDKYKPDQKEKVIEEVLLNSKCNSIQKEKLR